QRAGPEQARGERHDPDPAPRADRAGEGQGDQRDADDDANGPIQAADVGFHTGSPVGWAKVPEDSRLPLQRAEPAASVTPVTDRRPTAVARAGRRSRS